MAIACVTSVTPDIVSVAQRGGALIIQVDGVGLWMEGASPTEQLHNLAMIAAKLLNAHDRIAAQQRLPLGGEA